MRKTVDVQWVRRTFARLEWLRRRFTPERFADELMKHGVAVELWVQIAVSAEFLCHLRDRLDARIGEMPDRTRPCAVCGGHIWTERSDARYCSPACRQRAYRARVTDPQSERTTDPSPGDTSPRPSDAEGVTTTS